PGGAVGRECGPGPPLHRHRAHCGVVRHLRRLRERRWMSNFLSEGPFWAVFTALFFGAMARGQLLYWIGRIPTEQALKRTAPTTGWQAKVHRWLSDGGADAGVRSIQRWGLPIVSLCYVTVGFQSLVQAAAGMLRTPLLWYILAQIPGALAW